ncbi:MAG: ABC transporter substrate-binding protein [Candidatus Hodarchaeota archaeon]
MAEHTKTKVAILVLIVGVAGITTAAITWYQIDSKKIRVGYVNEDLHHFAIVTAIEKGMFIDAGLDLKFVKYTNDASLMEAMASGTVDMGYMDFATAIIANRNDSLGITLLASASVNGSALMGNNESGDKIESNYFNLHNNQTWIPGINTIENLFLKLAINTSLANASFNYDDNMTIVVKAENELVSSIGKNRTFVGTGIYRALGENQTDAAYIYKSEEVWPNHPSSVIGARNGFLEVEENREIAKRILAVLVDATDFINDPANHDDVLTLAVRYLGYSELVPEHVAVVESALDSVGFVYAPNDTMLEEFVDNLIYFDFIANITDVTAYLESFYNQSILKQLPIW